MSVAKGVREVGWYWLLTSVLAWPLVIVACFGVLLPPAIEIGRATRGLIQPTLLFSVVLFVVVVLGGVRWGGRLRASDIGLVASRIRMGLLVTLGVWVTLHVILLIVTLVGRESAVSLNPGPWTMTLGLLAGQVFGAAFVEESMFRGFLVPQLYLKFGGRGDRTLWRPMLGAILVAQLAFALIHIPNLHRLGVPGGSPAGKLAVIFVLGVFFVCSTFEPTTSSSALDCML